MKLIKRLVIVGLVLVLLLVGGVVFAFFKIDSLVKIGIQEGGTQAMGVPTKVDSVSVGLFSGTAGLKGLSIANPAGFKQPNFFTLGDGSLAVDLNSLNSNVVEVPKISLSGMTMSLERTAQGTNYGVILDNLKKLSSGGSSGGSSSGGGKQVIVHTIELKNIKVVADLIGAPGELTKIEVPIDSITLTDVGSGKDPKRMEVATIASTIVQAILQAVAEKGGGLPADLVGDLQNRLASLPQLGGFKIDSAVGQIKNLSGTVGEVGKKVEETTKKVGDEAKKTVDDVKKIGDDLKGLIPGKKKGD